MINVKIVKKDMSEKSKKLNHVAGKKDQYTVVLEQLNSQFKAFGESLAGFREKMEERFDKFEAKTEKNFEIVKNYLSNVTDDLDRISNEIKEMKSEPEKIDFDRVAELEKEVEYLKKEINKQGKLIQLKLCA